MHYQCVPEGQESIAHYDAIVDVGHIPCSEEEQVVEEVVPINVPVTPLEVPEFCGCIKVTEFIWQENLLTIWHQGKHKCNLKPDVKGQQEKLNEESKKQPPISIQLHNTSKEFQIDLIGYYILIGDMNRAVEMAQGLADKDLLRKLCNDDGKNLLTEIQ